MYEKIFICIIMLCSFCISCKSSGIISDNGTGNAMYRELESDIRDGETGLAITSTKLTGNGEKIAETSNELEQRLGKLEQSIKGSENNEQEIGEMLQRIRTRKITSDELTKFGIKFCETEAAKN